jgi:hypothetical protein
LVQKVCPRELWVSVVGRELDAVVELPTATGGSVAEKRPEPGCYEVEAVALPLEHELRMQRKVSPATRAELAVDDRRREFAG